MVWLGIDHNISQHGLWKDISVGFGVYGTHDIMFGDVFRYDYYIIG